MDSNRNVNPQKLDLDVNASNKKGTVAAGKLKIECTNTQTQKRQSRPRKMMSPSSGSVCNKKPRKEWVSKNSQKAGKNVYDLSDLIRGKRRSKPHNKQRKKTQDTHKKSKKSKKYQEEDKENTQKEEAEQKTEQENDIEMKMQETVKTDAQDVIEKEQVNVIDKKMVEEKG